MVSPNAGRRAVASASTREILVVDPGDQQSEPLAAALAALGFRTTTVASGYAALSALENLPIDAAILDLAPPDISGKEVIVRARTFCQTPIIVLSAEVPEEDKIEALDLGANDFLTRPFSIPELMARLRALLRSAAPATRPADPLGVSFDFEARRATVAGRQRSLTVRETELLRALDAVRGEAVPYDALLENIWGADSEANLTHLRVLAWQVRRKIEPDASNPRFLLVVPGQGYRLACAPPA